MSEALINKLKTMVKNERKKKNDLTFKISLAGLLVLFNDVDNPFTSFSMICSFIQRCMKIFHDWKERTATEIFLDRWSDAAMSNNAVLNLACRSCNFSTLTYV